MGRTASCTYLTSHAYKRRSQVSAKRLDLKRMSTTGLPLQWSNDGEMRRRSSAVVGFQPCGTGQDLGGMDPDGGNAALAEDAARLSCASWVPAVQSCGGRQGTIGPNDIGVSGGFWPGYYGHDNENRDDHGANVRLSEDDDGAGQPTRIAAEAQVFARRPAAAAHEKAKASIRELAADVLQKRTGHGHLDEAERELPPPRFIRARKSSLGCLQYVKADRAGPGRRTSRDRHAAS